MRPDSLSQWRLVVYCGIPGSGKTTHSRAAFKGSRLVCADVLRANAGGAELATAVFDQMAGEVARGLDAGDQVVVDACNVKRHHRLRWLRLAADRQVESLLIVMVTPVGMCRFVQQHREFPVPLPVVSKYHQMLNQELRRSIPAEPWGDVVLVNR